MWLSEEKNPGSISKWVCPVGRHPNIVWKIGYPDAHSGISPAAGPKGLNCGDTLRDLVEVEDSNYSGLI